MLDWFLVKASINSFYSLRRMSESDQDKYWHEIEPRYRNMPDIHFGNNSGRNFTSLLESRLRTEFNADPNETRNVSLSNVALGEFVDDEINAAKKEAAEQGLPVDQQEAEQRLRELILNLVVRRAAILFKSWEGYCESPWIANKNWQAELLSYLPVAGEYHCNLPWIPNDHWISDLLLRFRESVKANMIAFKSDRTELPLNAFIRCRSHHGDEVIPSVTEGYGRLLKKAAKQDYWLQHGRVASDTQECITVFKGPSDGSDASKFCGGVLVQARDPANVRASLFESYRDHLKTVLAGITSN